MSESNAPRTTLGLVLLGMLLAASFAGTAAAPAAAAAAPAAVAPKKVTPASIGLPGARRCVQARRMTFRLRGPRIRRARIVRINVNGRRVRTLSGRRARKRSVRLTRLRTAQVPQRVRRGQRRRAGTVLVTVSIVPRRGRKVVVRRRYRLCAGKARPGATRPGGSSNAPSPGAQGDGERADGFGPVNTGTRRALPGCADDTVFPGRAHPGGEWPVNGRDYDATRTQEQERLIGKDLVASVGLGQAWRFSSKLAGGAGDFTGTPVVTDGCVYAATTRGWVFAVNADTGRLVWRAQLPNGGKVYQSVAVRYGKVFAGVSAGTATDACTENCAQPFTVALDQETGRTAWVSKGLDEAQGTDILGAPLVFDASDNGKSDPVLFTGISAYGAEADFGDGAIRYRTDGSFVMLDAATGEVLRKTYVVKRDPEDEHAGCGIWSSLAVDFESRLGYVGVSNPHHPRNEHPHCNSVIEISVDRSAGDFGAIRRSFKGTPDDYVRGEQPGGLNVGDIYPCQKIPFVPSPTPSQEVGTCTDMDLAIGAPPNLIRMDDGRKMVGVGQKSGHYHLWDLATGQREWRSLLGVPTIIGGIVGATAFDGRKIYGPSTVPGFVFGVDKERGDLQWSDQHSVVSYGNPTTTANGLVYTTTQNNFVNVLDAETGARLQELPLPPGQNQDVGYQGTVGGIAVARNSVYAAVGNQSLAEGFIVAFRPGADGGGATGGDGAGGGGGDGEEPPAQSQSPASPLIVAGPGATSTGFPPAFLPKGQELNFLNLDNAAHDVRSKDSGPDGKPLFSSDIGPIGTPVAVQGASKLEGGKAYGFVCTIHPSMNGTLVVGP